METITINIPENKIAEQSTSCNGSIIINFKDKPNGKDWWYYIVGYEKYVFDKVGSILIENRWGNNPLTWPIEYKFGLLKFIADDLNESGLKSSIIGCSDNKIYTQIIYSYWSSHVMFDAKGAQKAIEIIPIEFIKSF